MSKQYLDKDGLEVVRNKVNEAREVSAGAMALAESISQNVTPTFTGTFAQWNALSSADKSKYKIVNITDDTSDVQNAVRNPDWSRAVNYTIDELYAGLQMPDDGIFIAVIQNRTKTNPGYENRLYVAGKPIGYCYETSNTPEPLINCQVPVNKGDSVYLDGVAGAFIPYNMLFFVPYKTEVVITEPMNYSTTEQFTGKYWIDGKKIYRQCWDLTLTSYSDSGNRRVHTSAVLKAGVTFISAIGGMYAALQNNSGTLVHTNWFPITNIVASTSMTENCNAGCGVSPSGDLTVSVTSITTLDWQEAYAKVWIEYTK